MRSDEPGDQVRLEEPEEPGDKVWPDELDNQVIRWGKMSQVTS